MTEHDYTIHPDTIDSVLGPDRWGAQELRQEVEEYLVRRWKLHEKTGMDTPDAAEQAYDDALDVFSRW